jgi:hypothetical protein
MEALLASLYDGDTPTIEKTHPHALAIFFMCCCIGNFYDPAGPPQTDTEQYHALGRAAISHVSVVNHRSCSSVQALLLINVYKFISPQPSTEWRWLMSGITARVAQALGLRT